MVHFSCFVMELLLSEAVCVCFLFFLLAQDTRSVLAALAAAWTNN